MPPTRERVERMLAGTASPPHELLGEMPPNYGRLTVEKVASNAVMAGCRPVYLPVLIAAVVWACDPEFNLHGVSTSTHFSAPLIPVNGPIHVSRGLSPESSAVTVFAGEAHTGSSDHASRTARALAGSLGWSMAGLRNSRHFPLSSHAMLVVGRERARTFAGEGWTREDLARHLHVTIRVPYASLLPDENHGEGTNLR